MIPPLVDIVILVHDRADWAELCVRAVEHFTKNSYRLIIVDMASQEAATKGLFELWRHAGHTVINLADNKSFSHGVNTGVRAGSAKHVIVLNDDAIVTEGWDSALLSDVNQTQVGMVGARSNFAAGAQGGQKCHGDPPWLVFVCVCFKREHFEHVMGMDDVTFDGFSTEDIDFSWKIVKAGLRLKVSSAYVLHAGSRTLAKQMAAGGDAQATSHALAKNNEKYNARLFEKWGKQWVSEHTKFLKRILVATFSPQETVYMDFARACMSLKQAGGYEFSFYHSVRRPIHIARQEVSDFACNNDFDVLVQLDDDSTFPADVLGQLVAHEKEVVAALAYQRGKPYAAVAYELDSDALAAGKTMGRNLEGMEGTGLRKVDVSGFHVSAIRTSVIKKMREHRCEKHPEGIKRYWGGFDELGEDFAFALHLRHLGIPLYVDTNLVAGHIASPYVVGADYKMFFQQGKAQ